MSNRRRAALVALPAAAVLLAATAAPASGQTTSPTPSPAAQGQVAADAGAGLFVLRALPGLNLPSLPTLPGLPVSAPVATTPDGTGGLLTAAFALTRVTADSTKPAGQMSTATSSPGSFSLAGTPAPNPTTLSQSALPDHPTPTTGGFAFPNNPLLTGGLLQGSAQARWSTTLGPCVDPISSATTSLASLTAIPGLPSLNLPTATDPANPLTGLTSMLANPASGLGTLTSAVPGLGAATGSTTPSTTPATATPTTSTTSAVSLPDTSSSTSTTRLIDVAGQGGKGVQAVSKVQFVGLTLFEGTPMAAAIKVVSQPTLTATSTGNPDTSNVTYTSPVLTITANGVTQTLDAQNPTANVPFSLPLPANTPGLSALLGALKLPADSKTLDLGVLKIQVGQFTQQKVGASVGGTASLLDVALLPTNALSTLLGSVPGAGGALPTSLLQVGIGEQTARASVSAGGVSCAAPAAAAPAPTAATPQASGTPPLAYTSGAYSAIPLVWTGSVLLILGAVIVAALPRRRRVTGTA